MQDVSDAQLIKDHLGGDERSLELLFARYLKPVFSFVARMVGDAADADDVTQETFVRVWRNLGKFDPEKKFSTWAFQIAKNAALDALKKKKALPFSAFDDEAGRNVLEETLADPAELPSELLERADIAKTVTDALAGLPLHFRTVLYLRYNDHLTFEEIAETLGEPMNTVKSRHRRALIALKTLLTE